MRPHHEPAADSCGDGLCTSGGPCGGPDRLVGVPMSLHEFAPLPEPTEPLKVPATLFDPAEALRQGLRLTEAVMAELLHEGPAVLGPRPDTHGHRD